MIIVFDSDNVIKRMKYIALKYKNFDWQNLSYLFIKSILNTVKDMDGKKVYCLWDISRSAYRLNHYKEYKANRDNKEETEEEKLMTETLVLAKNYLINNLKKIGITSIALPEIEADDISYYITHLYKNEKGTLVTEDKDWYLNITTNWKVYHPVKKITVDQKIFNELMENDPNPKERFLLYKALIGDTSDNIKGVDGVGEKNGLKYSEHLLYNKDLGTSKIAEKIKNSSDIIDLNKKLMDISWIMTQEDIKEKIDHQRTLPNDNVERTDWDKFYSPLSKKWIESNSFWNIVRNL